MKVKNILIPAMCLLAAKNTCGQEKQIRFDYKTATKSSLYMNQNILPLDTAQDKSIFKGIPKGIPVFEVYAVTIDECLEAYNEFKRKEITEKELTDYLSYYGVPVEELAKLEGRPNQIYIYVGLDKPHNKKYIKVDANRDLDFRNDAAYTTTIDDGRKRDWHKEDLTSFTVQISFKTGGQTVKFPLAVYAQYHDKTESRHASKDKFLLDIGVATNDFMQGSILLGGKPVLVNADIGEFHSLSERDRIKKNPTFLFYVPGKKYPQMPPKYVLGDTLVAEGRLILLKSVKDNRLYIQDLKAADDSSQVGSIFPYSEARLLAGGKQVDIRQLVKGKYTFIDFWGSWCHPCIATLPQLLSMYEKVKERKDAMILSLALEREATSDKLEKVVREKAIPWTNLWTPGQEAKFTTSPHGKLKVYSYPTYLIVDDEGRIVYRAGSEENAPKAVEFFLNLLQEKK